MRRRPSQSPRLRDRRRRRQRILFQRVFALLLIVGAVVAIAAIVLAPRGRPPVRTASPRERRPPVHRAAPVARRRVRRFPDSRAAVPILMYHVIADPPAGAPFPGLYVPPAEFADQMNALAAAGFHAVTLDRMWAGWHGRAALPPHPIVITFDNGYRSQYTEAAPILRRLGWVGDENMQLAGLPPSQGGLLPREVRALVREGWEVDTQGYSHADLPTLDPSTLAFQIDRARQLLAREYGIHPRWFCYPSGRYDGNVVAAVRAAGFIGSTTVVPGWATSRDDPFALPRLRVLGGTSGAALLALLRGWRPAST